MRTYTSTDGEDVVEIRGDEYTCYTRGYSEPLYRGTDENAAIAAHGIECWDDIMAADPIEALAE